MKKKSLITVLALVLVFAVAVGGVVAWLTSVTATVTNTFTVGDINIKLEETKSDFKMVPGNTIEKDPKVTVEKDSEACWLFVKVDESSDLGTYISYNMADGWTQLEVDGTKVNGVYYREVAETTADTDFAVLKDNKVTVKTDVTKAQLDDVDEGDAIVTLTFTAAAVQKDNIESATDAYAKLPASFTGETEP